MIAAWTLSAAAVISGVVYIWTTYAGTQTQRYLFKPLTTGLILLVVLTLPDPVSALYRGLVAAGIIFSLAGDVFLMLPGNTFVWGLVSFLVAHLFYIGAYVSRGGFRFHWFVLLPFVLYGAVLLYLLWPHIGEFRIPVIFYAVVLVAMG
ncbi:MAG: lysoplasmalogenase, partial [Caldilineaceae bacterium]|nr:lysoplasmalogenase [Caldilineaceae bacterium]